MEIIAVIAMAAAAVAVVLYPFVRGRGVAAPARTGQAVAARPLDDATLAAEVARYREALRAGSACRRCFTANAPGSRFCAECGRRLVSDT